MDILATLSMEEYGIIGLVMLAVFALLKKQLDITNRLILGHAKQREEDLDKIAAALIIIQEISRDVSGNQELLSKNQESLSKNQELLTKDMTLVRDLIIQKIMPTQS